MRLIESVAKLFKTYTRPDPSDESAAFYSGRQQRYYLFWSYYINSSYDSISSLLKSYGPDSRMYKWTRGLYNPINRYVQFYSSNIWGGYLDPEAGDGHRRRTVVGEDGHESYDVVGSSIPIVTENQNIRPAIAQIWKWSNWNSKRTLATNWGSAVGDVAIKVVDNTEKEKVYLQVLWPGKVEDAVWDDFGNLKMVKIRNTVPDIGEEASFSSRLGNSSQLGDSGSRRMIDIHEVIEHPDFHKSGDFTRVTTIKGNAPFPYYVIDGRRTASWTLPYDFVPVVIIPFKDVGSGWGITGYFHAQRKIDESNSIASQIHDQIGKSLNTPLVTFGIKKSDLEVTNTPGRIPMIHIPLSPQEAGIERMIYDLNLSDSLLILNRQLSEIQADLPELAFREVQAGGSMSGEALERVFSDVISTVESTRSNFDDALVRAHNMAMAIGGIREYSEVFSGFDIDSYESGRLDHVVGQRPVLPPSQSERLDIRYRELQVERMEQALRRDQEMTEQGMLPRNNGSAITRNPLLPSDRDDPLRQSLREAAQGQRSLESTPAVGGVENQR